MTGWGPEWATGRGRWPRHQLHRLTGALHAIGRAGEKPVPPLNLVGDFGGGGMLLALGRVCTLFEAQRSGQGKSSTQRWSMERLLMAKSIGFTAKYISIGSLEPQSFALLMKQLDLEDTDIAQTGMVGGKGFDPTVWNSMKPRLAAILRTRTRDEWCALLEGTDACFAPVLSLTEAGSCTHE